jgi:hypothetical protein
VNWTIVFALVALVLGAIEELRARGQNLLAWAVIALGLAIAWPFLK